ncbi:MAG: GNAT family N-acetyltransferase [Spirochaetia bacterium]|nr:GNAT family N-acetyltransferase [Spirochaetia bacterium]
MIIERATKEDYQELKTLWNIVFDEDLVFLEHFFSKRIFFDHIFVARIDQKIVSALHALPLAYQKEGKKYPTSYIVGAATYKEYRKRGIMSKLLAAVEQAYEHPITLFPAVRPFYEANGYTTTSYMERYPLQAAKSENIVSQRHLDLAMLSNIYDEATRKTGSLYRDREAWSFLTDGYETVLADGAYAFISENKAVEAMALDIPSAQKLLQLLQDKEVETIQVLENSPFSELLDAEKKVLTPMGMSTKRDLQGIYIAEQY